MMEGHTETEKIFSKKHLEELELAIDILHSSCPKFYLVWWEQGLYHICHDPYPYQIQSAVMSSISDGGIETRFQVVVIEDCHGGWRWGSRGGSSNTKLLLLALHKVHHTGVQLSNALLVKGPFAAVSIEILSRQVSW